MSSIRVRQAKQFLVSRILDQAKREGVELTPLEIQMLGFAEEAASAVDFKAAQAFERDVDDQAYEKKIAELIRHAYQQDEESGRGETWDMPLAAVAETDMYLDVMIERAKIGGSIPPLLEVWFIVNGILPLVAFIVPAIVIGFTPFGARLVRNESLRLVVVLLLIAFPLIIGRFWRWREPRKVSELEE